MKRIFNLLPLLFLSLTACNKNNSKTPVDEPEDDNVAQVVVLLGQSNMEGHSQTRFLNKTLKDKAPEYIGGYEDVLINFCNSQSFSSGNNFVKTRCGFGVNNGAFGPEVGIAEKMHENNKDNVYLVKFAQGATSLASHWTPPSVRTPDGGPLYRAAKNFILKSCETLESMGLYPEIKAICWMQGEDDSNGSFYNNYYRYTKSFISDLRNDLAYYMDLDGIGFIDAAIAATEVWQQHEVINNAKRLNAEEDPLSFYIDTNSSGMTTRYEPVEAPDIYHYDSSSMITLGHLFGDVLLNNFIN